MVSDLTRREFLKLSLLSTSVLGMGGFPATPIRRVTPPYPNQPLPVAIGRVTVPAIYLYEKPSLKGERVGKAIRDELLSLLEEVISPSGPPHNPIWYRVLGGYAHSGRIQRIESLPANPPLSSIPENGLLGEITVPYIRSQRYSRSAGWRPLYLLYYGSLHWITAIEQGPGGETWYRLRDTLLNVLYSVPASAVRPIFPREYSPVSTFVPPDDKRIVISIGAQSLVAYEADRPVLQTSISSGIHSEQVPEGELPTDTPLGNFHIQLKMPSRHMGDGRLTDDQNAYELPGVPWTMVFHETGVALHGTYWHDNFGTRMSHGCVNLRSVDAKWLFRWTEPVYQPVDWYKTGYGTLVQIVE